MKLWVVEGKYTSEPPSAFNPMSREAFLSRARALGVAQGMRRDFPVLQFRVVKYVRATPKVPK